MASKNNLPISGRSVEEVLYKARDEVRKHGALQKTYEGERNVLHNVSLVLENLDDTDYMYPFWEEDDDEWYLDAFVRPKYGPPEQSTLGYVFAYTYAWRSRFHDQGWGHVFKLIMELQKRNYTDLPLTRKEDVDLLIRETYQIIHPDLVLAILDWFGHNTLKNFLLQPILIEQILFSFRQDLLEELVLSLNSDISAEQPVVPIAAYTGIRTSNMLEHAPNLISYQVIPVVDKEQTVIGLEAVHIYNHLILDGSTQLEFSHSRDWANYIYEETGLPILKVTLFSHQLMKYAEEENTPNDIRNFTFAKSSAYQPEYLDLEAFLNLKSYQSKVQRILSQF